MPETDRTFRVGEMSRTILKRVRKTVREQVFLGPSRVRLSPTEALDRLKAMTGDERKELMASIGPDAFMQQIEDLMERAGDSHTRT